MLKLPTSARVGIAALGLVLGFAAASPAQDAQLSLDVARFTTTGEITLFKTDIVEPARPRVPEPSVTMIQTPTGPMLRTVALTLPASAVTSRLGDQPLPRTFTSSALSGNSLKRPIRGLSLSNSGASPWSITLGQLDASGRPDEPLDTPGVMAISMGLPARDALSVTPRALVPVGGSSAQSSVGTAIRAEVNPHLSFVSDLGAAGTRSQGWDPVAAASVVGHWKDAELETNLLRGASSADLSPETATVGSLDREVVRGLVRSIPGMTISAQASWSRPAREPVAEDTTVAMLGLAYDRLPIGVLTASTQDEDGVLRDSSTTRIEWRRAPVGGVVVRYIEKRQTASAVLPDATSRQVEFDLPGWIERDFGNRVDVQAVLTDDSVSASPSLSSRFTGRFDVFHAVRLSGETELGLAGAGQPLLRTLRVTSSVPVRKRTALKFLYSYQAPGPFTFNNQSFEARLSQAIPIFTW